MTYGKITQVIGPVVDVEFSGIGVSLPAILNALTVEVEGQKLVLECQGHLGASSVRTISMGPTEKLKRGLDVSDTGAPISVPVGKETLGRMFNVTGLGKAKNIVHKKQGVLALVAEIFGHSQPG